MRERLAKAREDGVDAHELVAHDVAADSLLVPHRLDADVERGRHEPPDEAGIRHGPVLDISHEHQSAGNIRDVIPVVAYLFGKIGSDACL